MSMQEAQDPSREERIAAASDEEALAIVDLVAGELATMDSPAGEREQRAALAAAFAAAGVAVDPAAAADADTAAAGRAARELLRLMARVPELRPALDIWLDAPPRQEALAVPLVLAVPAVYAGCIALLQVIGHSRLKRHPSGGWEFEYDASTPTSMDATLGTVVEKLADLIRPLIPGGGKT